MGETRDVAVGAMVGVTDICFVYPLAVLACRREAGMSMRQSLRAGNYWSGASTQSILIPYSILVEAGTKAMNRQLGQGPPLLGPLAISAIVGVSLQPVEKMLTIQQLLQTQNTSAQSAQASSNPLKAMRAYQQAHGMRALYKGLSCVVLREFIYIASITVVNPYAVRYSEQLTSNSSFSRAAETMAAFSVGFTAGMVSAPVQTVNAMMKDERNRSSGLADIVRRDLSQGFVGNVRRLYFGSFIRSLRCGGAGVLYHTWRTVLSEGESITSPEK
ncbi:Hypothetical Protein FCC1311_026042 [Hondaea fermentalgiana]|uniref:Uncharacterized protein n=1 Tax=Hondaea fermentalgiana TaxID=2315210 RepID=A0A2R5GCR9_9STRA|nr:Hypothetical Protein FCC1311_026042 [Hondaea fermentalgiana]|eukprot:GBG26383.1 Hypothetical Protein FCC1311_026042 [Hondaea fermentalgiana]